MFLKSLLRLPTAALLIGLGMAPASAAPSDRLASLPLAEPATASGAARPIIAWQEFCNRNIAECRVDLSQPERIALTPQTWKLLVDVNAKVNRSLRPLTDLEHWGVVDHWDFGEDGFGDCEDYQLLKRRRLAEAGLPRRAMLMTVVLDENNEGHAVLMVRTDRGDIVLDNKRDEVLTWQQTGYVYVKRESQTETAWVSLNHASGVTATASKR